VGRRSGVSIQTTTYSQFKGVDFSTDASLVSRDRAPWAVNMIADTGGMPEKRMGWRTLHQLDAPVNGVFFAQRYIAGQRSGKNRSFCASG